VRVVVFGQENLSRVYGVDGAGYVSMVLVRGVHARGLTIFQLGATIVSSLKAK
jgi:polysaccharide export outer membrane protein